jgi:predicted amidohydrolase
MGITIQNGSIVTVGPGVAGIRTVNANGCYVFPELMEGKIGTLKPRAFGDVSVFKRFLKRRYIRILMALLLTEELLISQTMVIGGDISSCQGYFALV